MRESNFLVFSSRKGDAPAWVVGKIIGWIKVGKAGKNELKRLRNLAVSRCVGPGAWDAGCHSAIGSYSSSSVILFYLPFKNFFKFIISLFKLFTYLLS